MAEQTEKRVLVADDEQGVQKFLQALLVEMGCQVVLAENGHVAFRKATSSHFDLILMDIAMPDWNGMDAIRSLNMVKPEQPIIVISAFLDDALVSELKEEENVVGWFKKPVEIDSLSEAINKAFA